MAALEDLPLIESEDDEATGKQVEEKTYFNGDPLDLQSSDHPGMQLVTSHLTGQNYLSWSRSIKIALGAKLKLGFINGRCEKSVENSAKFEQWVRVDCMVRSWLLNSISKEIVEAFIYTLSAKDLWEELKERYGECNGPLLYQLQREIGSISQGMLTIEKYFTKLKKLWDELACLMPIPICTCAAVKEVSHLTAFNRLMQFLMGLNDTFDHIRNQILVMDPLPSVNKAYSMVLRVEKQREVHTIFPEVNDSSAMLIRTTDYKRDYGGRTGNYRGFSRGRFGRGNYGVTRGTTRRFGAIERENSHCDHCNMSGHTKDTCFKLNGYPDWYKDLKEQRSRNITDGRFLANMADTPLDFNEDQLMEMRKNDTAVSTNIADIVKLEVHKALKGKLLMDNKVNFTHVKEYAGPAE